MQTGIRRGLRKWCAAALPLVRLHIARNAGVRLDMTTDNQRCGIAKLESEQTDRQEALS